MCYTFFFCFVSSLPEDVKVTKSCLEAGALFWKCLLFGVILERFLHNKGGTSPFVLRGCLVSGNLCSFTQQGHKLDWGENYKETTNGFFILFLRVT